MPCQDGFSVIAEYVLPHEYDGFMRHWAGPRAATHDPTIRAWFHRKTKRSFGLNAEMRPSPGCRCRCSWSCQVRESTRTALTLLHCPPLLVTSATLVVTGALLVVTMFAVRNKKQEGTTI